jgi:hypothetical protein
MQRLLTAAQPERWDALEERSDDESNQSRLLTVDEKFSNQPLR